MLFDNVTQTSGVTQSAQSQSGSDKKKLDETLNSFLSLLVTQLQHQDPLEPMDANQFTTQLVQFSSVEQQIYQNAHLEALLAQQKEQSRAGSTGYLGTSIEIEGDRLALVDGAAAATYTLSRPATKVSITVSDSNGDVVLNREGDGAPGRHAFAWNGLDDGGEPLPDGRYKLTVTANGADGAPIEVASTVLGRVTGVSYEGEEPALLVGDLAVPLSNVKSVAAPPAERVNDAG